MSISVIGLMLHLVRLSVQKANPPYSVKEFLETLNAADKKVQEGIAQALTAASRDAAWRQYVQVLLGRAKIEGIDLEGADTPLVQ